VRLVNPDYHCQFVRFAENTFVHDMECSRFLKRNMILFVLGASGRFKHWGTENYIALAQRLTKDGYSCQFLLGPKELEYKETLQDAGFETIDGVSFAGIACLMNAHSRTKCVIGNDTGLMHMACCLDVPSVTISSDEARFTWFPYHHERHGICFPVCSKVGCLNSCKRDGTCMELIGMNQVLSEFYRVIEVC